MATYIWHIVSCEWLSSVYWSLAALVDAPSCVLDVTHKKVVTPSMA